jgi:hypothetical protein
MFYEDKSGNPDQKGAPKETAKSQLHSKCGPAKSASCEFAFERSKKRFLPGLPDVFFKPKIQIWVNFAVP